MEKELKVILDKLYREMNSVDKIGRDPVSFPHKFVNEEDIQLSAFISSCFAFGKVDKILETLDKIFSTMDYTPYEYLKNSSFMDIEKDFRGFVYRFVNEKSVAEFLHCLSLAIKKGGLYSFVEDNIVDTAGNIKRFFFSNASNPDVLKKSNLLCDIEKGSACKRLSLFFRWMVRKDNVDFGLWRKKLKPSGLIIPLDTHILRISKRLGFTKRKNSSFKTAKEITEYLKKFDGEDPVKYDFSLCHTGIQGICNADVDKAKCELCYLKEFCIEGKMKTNKLNGGFNEKEHRSGN